MLQYQRTFISGWSLYPYHDRSVQSRIYSIDIQTRKSIEDVHPFYGDLWIEPDVRIGQKIKIAVNHWQEIKEFTVLGIELVDSDIGSIPCWKLEGEDGDEHYTLWFDRDFGIRIRYESAPISPVHTSRYSANTVWKLVQISPLSKSGKSLFSKPDALCE